jgi:hypothetical protein
LLSFTGGGNSIDGSGVGCFFVPFFYKVYFFCAAAMAAYRRSSAASASKFYASLILTS